MTIRRIGAFIAAAAFMYCSSFSSSVAAHHGEAGAYFLNETIKVEGVVKDVRWSNPHVYVDFDVTGAGAAVGLDSMPDGLLHSQSLVTYDN